MSDRPPVAWTGRGSDATLDEPSPANKERGGPLRSLRGEGEGVEEVV